MRLRGSRHAGMRAMRCALARMAFHCSWGPLRARRGVKSFSEKLNDYGIALEPSLFANTMPVGGGAARR